MRLNMKLFILSALVSGCLFFQEGISQDKLQGEKLDPMFIGPGVVESMEKAIERDKKAKDTLKTNHKDRKPGEQGTWVIPERDCSHYPHSGDRYVMNRWGDTKMGVKFPYPVDLHGAYFAPQDKEGRLYRGVKALGYFKKKLKAETSWLRNEGLAPKWLDMNFKGVDRVVIVSQPVVLGGGWYAMDDLTYTPIGQPNPKKVVLTFDDLKYKTVLTGSDYGDLQWEYGFGDFKDSGVQAPKIPKKSVDPEAGPAGAAFNPPMLSMAAPPTLLSSFQGVIRGDAGSNSYPPDTDGAIGPNHFVETVNRNFAVYDKTTGAELINILLGSFLPGSNGDPRVLFDQYSNRWIVLVTDFSDTDFLAVSLTDDPTGAWFKSSFKKCNSGDFPDYPTLGVDANGIYTASYIVGDSAMTLAAIDKAPLIAPIPQMGTVTLFKNLPLTNAIQPAHTYGTVSGEYLVSLSGGSSILVRKVNPPLTAPTLTTVGAVTIPGYSNPPNAPALGSTVDINIVDDRLMMALYRDGSIFTAHNVGVNGRCACRWYEIDAATASLVQYGTVSDPSLSYFFPAIMVNKNGAAVMGFSGSNSSQYVGCYYTGRLATDPPGHMAPPVMYKAGSAAQNNIDSYGRNRWGDYSYTTLDPVNGEIFWTIQEYGHGNNIWGTYICELEVEKPSLVMLFEDTVPDTLPPGLASSFFIRIENGKENYVPGSGKLLYRFDKGAFNTLALTDLGSDLFEGVLPNTRPGDEPEFYFSAQGNGGATVLLPFDAPNSLYKYDVAFVDELFVDDFETDKGWTVNNISVSTGAFERANPEQTGYQPEDDHTPSGVLCYVTDATAGSGNGSYDLDGGPTQLISPTLDLSIGEPYVEAYIYFAHSTNGTFEPFQVHLSGNNGTNWVKAADLNNNPSWTKYVYKVSDFITPTSTMKVRFSAEDNPNDSLVEALVDDFRVINIITDASLWANAYGFSASAAAQVDLSLDAGTSHGGRNYLLLGSVSGTSPGFFMPGGLKVPLNWDLFTNLIALNLNTPIFSNFQGFLDSSGQAGASLNISGPVGPSYVGLELTFVFLLGPNPAWNFASNPITIVIGV